MMKGAEEWGGRGQEGKHKHALLYAGDSMVTSSDPRWIQGAFSTLVGQFHRVILKTNVGKTVIMVCCPYQAEGKHSEAAYRRMMT